jgi:hypothetical protein
MIGRYFIASTKRQQKKKNKEFKEKLSTKIALFIHTHIKKLSAKTLAKYGIFIGI